MEATATKLTSIGTKMSLAVTLPLILMGRSAVKTFASLEDGFTGVQKTVNASTAELAALKIGFEDMSLVVPIALTELFKIGEAAGQLGIETEKILDFTKVMADLGVTTNLSSDEAATALARFANITNMSQDNFDRLGSTLVGLGNEFETTESEIVSMALRLGSAGSQIGLTEAQILALSTALSSVGLRAEQGGVSFSRVMFEMNTAVKSSTESLGVFADVSQMSRKEFSRLFNTDATQAIDSFVEGLVNLRDNGQDLMPIFESIGLSGVRVVDVLGRMSGRTGSLSKAFNQANKFWEENTALAREAALRYATFNSQMQLVKNAVTLLSADIGKQLVPSLLWIGDVVKDVTLWFRMLDESTKKLVVRIGVIAAGIPLAIISLGLLGKALLFIKASMWAIASLTATMIPIIAIIAALGVAIYSISLVWRTAFVSMRDSAQQFTKVIADMWNKVVPMFSSAYLYMVRYWNESLGDMTGALGRFASNYISTFIGLANSVKNIFKGNFNFKETFSQGFVEMDSLMKKLANKFFRKARTYTQKGFEEIAGVSIAGIGNVISESFTDVFTANLNLAKKDMVSFIDWLDTITKKFRPDDPALDVVEGLRRDTEALIKAMEGLHLLLKRYILKLKESPEDSPMTLLNDSKNLIQALPVSWNKV